MFQLKNKGIDSEVGDKRYLTLTGFSYHRTVDGNSSGIFIPNNQD